MKKKKPKTLKPNIKPTPRPKPPPPPPRHPGITCAQAMANFSKNISRAIDNQNRVAQEKIEKEVNAKTLEKLFSKKKIKKAKKFCKKRNIDYYTYLCTGFDKSLMVDLILKRHTGLYD